MTGSILSSAPFRCGDCGARFSAPVLPNLGNDRHLYYSRPGQVVGYLNEADCRGQKVLKRLTRTAGLDCSLHELRILLLACAERSSAGGSFYLDPTPTCPRCVGCNVQVDGHGRDEVSARIEPIRFDGFILMPPDERFKMLVALKGVDVDQWPARVRVPAVAARRVSEIALPELMAQDTAAGPRWEGGLNEDEQCAAPGTLTLTRVASGRPLPDGLSLNASTVAEFRSGASTLMPMDLAGERDSKVARGPRWRFSSRHRRDPADEGVPLLSGPAEKTTVRGGHGIGWYSALGVMVVATCFAVTLLYSHVVGDLSLPPWITAWVSGERSVSASAHSGAKIAVLSGHPSEKQVGSLIASHPQAVLFRGLVLSEAQWLRLTRAWTTTAPERVLIAGLCDSRCLSLSVMAARRELSNDAVLRVTPMASDELALLKRAGVSPMLLTALADDGGDSDTTPFLVGRDLAVATGLVSPTRHVPGQDMHQEPDTQ